ncbi:MAG: hypothetical protein AB7E46_02370 [Desulfovibrio sp.]
MSVISSHLPDSAVIRRRLRLVFLLDSAEAAGLTPIPITLLHAYAYLSNVLAPVWELSPLDGKVLKRKGGPFYPALQQELDNLVGMGMAVVSNLGYALNENNTWRLQGFYKLNRQISKPVLDLVNQFEEETKELFFIKELGYALSALRLEDLHGALLEDATYSDPVAQMGNVVDFAEWKDANFSTNAANYFENYFDRSSSVSPGNKLHLYVRHLYRRANAAS